LSVVRAAEAYSQRLQVRREWSEETHRAHRLGLRALDLSERNRALDEDRAIADVAPAERERLTRAQAAVCEH
jgi:hypothetical protein